MNDGERLIERLDQSRRAMRRALSSVDAQREICPGWTTREILAHIAGWDEVGTSTVRAHSAGETPPPLEIRGIDAYNDFLVSKCEGLTYEEVVQCWRSARRELEEALTDAPPEKLRERAQFPWGETGNITRLVSILAEHEREHADEILELVSGEDYPEDEEE
ncbi:MAG: maleylpyruvate isomerase N-terminal domain-containing protein [Anaerolineae bacterium]|jgi:hypothetical protein